MNLTKDNHEIRYEQIISSYRYGNENVFTFGQLGMWPTLEKYPEYYDNHENHITGYTFQVSHVEVDGDVDKPFQMEFDNLVDAMNLHHKLYNLSYTDEWKEYFTQKRKEEMEDMFDIEDKNQLKKLLNLEDKE